jgi:hypothetical protein
MSGSRFRLSRRHCVFTLAAAIAFPAVLPGQQPEQRNIRSITQYQLKPDRAADFRAIVKEINAVLRKAGHNRPASWWAAQAGEAKLAVVTTHAKWEELDAPPAAFREARADLAPLQARAMQCVNRMERTLDVILPEYSSPPSQEIPAAVAVMRVVVRPERIQDYLALQKSEVVPAYQKAGLTGIVFSRTRLGGPNHEFRRVVPAKGFIALDGEAPLITAIGGQAAYEKYLAKITPMLVESEFNIYRRVPELDFIPAK